MSSMNTLAIGSEALKQIIDHAYAEYPYEVCGLMGGHDNLVEVVAHVPNASLTPHTAFELERQAMVDEIVSFQRNNQEVIAIYHSHPNGSAEPDSISFEQHDVVHHRRNSFYGFQSERH